MRGLEEEQRLLMTAAAPTLDRIRRDKKESSPSVKRALELLEEDLYNPDLCVDSWLRFCDGPENIFAIRFHGEMGLAPGAYLWDCRLETGCRLLWESDLSVSDVGQLVGYSGRQTFSRAFEKWCGLRPSIFRRKMSQIPDSLDRRIREKLLSTPFLRKIQNGVLEAEERGRLIVYLEGVYLREQNSSITDEEPTNFDEDKSIEAQIADTLWRRVRDLPFIEQRAIVRRQVGFETTALFYLLLEKSRETGRKDRQLGVEVAKLALASLEACDESLQEELSNRHAEGWICVSHAQRLALDFAHSEQSCVFAEAQLQIAGMKANPAIAAELSACKAALRWFQRRYDEALELVERSIEEFRELEAPASLARALLLQFNIRRQSWGNCVPVDDLREAASLIDADEHAYLMASCYTHKTLAHLDREELEQARSAVSRAKEFCYKTDYKIGLCVVQWLDGLVQQGRESRKEAAIDCFQNAIKGFDESGELAYAAMVSLDLAILYKNLGQSSRVVEMASSAIPVLDALKIQRETFAALKLLRQAVEENEITMATLERLRVAVMRILHDPVARERLLSSY